MSTIAPAPRPWPWLVLAGVIAVIAIAVLWPMQHIGQICIMIYPPPAGCGSPVPPIAAIGAIAVILALLVAIVVVWFTVRAPRTVVVILTAAIVVVTLFAIGAIALSQTGIWDPPVLPVG